MPPAADRRDRRPGRFLRARSARSSDPAAARASAPAAPPRPTPRACRAPRPSTSASWRAARAPRRPGRHAARRRTTTARMAVARRAGSPGSTRTPAGPTTSGSAPTALATTGTPAASASSAAIPDASERTGWTSIRAPATSAASRSGGRRGRIRDRIRHARAHGRARHRRAIPGRGVHEADAGRPEARGHGARRVLLGEGREGREQRGQVLAGVVAARVDDVPLPRGPRRSRSRAAPAAASGR